MTRTQVNSVLKASDRVVFFASGHHTGDIDFAGSRVTLFGEGALGGRVVIDGNVTVSGSNSRIRGTQITGNLTISASGVGLSFSRVDGTAHLDGERRHAARERAMRQPRWCRAAARSWSATPASRRSPPSREAGGAWQLCRADTQVDLLSRCSRPGGPRPEELAREMRFAAGIHWYGRGEVSQKKAA
jgi:hypothetical protein